MLKRVFDEMDKRLNKKMLKWADEQVKYHEERVEYYKRIRKVYEDEIKKGIRE
jgi:hypothetical protein